MNNSDEITNKSVRRCIRNSNFFANVDKLTKILKPIKTAVTLLESTSTNLADCFIQLILLKSINSYKTVSLWISLDLIIIAAPL